MTGVRPSRPPHALRAGVGASTGALSTAVVLAMWPVLDGVVWTTDERSLLALAGALVGGTAGLALGLTSGRAAWLGAVSTGLLPALLLRVTPLLPTEGVALLRVPLPVIGLWLGSAVVAWGLLRLVERPAAHLLAAALAGVGLVATWPAPPQAPAASAPPSGPDLLLVTVDTTRADLVPGFPGDLPAAEMPALEAWSQHARRFTQVYAPTALTGPSHTSVLSGQHVLEHGVVANGRAVPADLPWVPAELQAAGWRTQAWVSTAVLDAHHGFARGFARYDSRFTDRIHYGHPLLHPWPRRVSGGTGFVRADAETVDRALASGLSDPTGAQRTFTWVHLYGPHWPYTPAAHHAAALQVDPTLDTPSHGPVPLNQSSELSEPVRAHATALYRAELRTLDDQLARLFAAAGPDTLVVVAADHGESLDEHGLYFNHGRLSTAPTARVPVWVRGPGHPPGADDRLAGLAQVAHTLRDLAGLPPLSRGRSLADTPTDAVVRTIAAAEVFVDDDTPRRLGSLASLAVRSGGWSKTASVWHADRWSPLTADPREVRGSPEDSAPPEVRERIDAAWQATISAELGAVPPVDPATQQALEALGYVSPR